MKPQQLQDRSSIGSMPTAFRRLSRGLPQASVDALDGCTSARSFQSRTKPAIDQSTHSLFGASKVAADIMVQEYGHYFGMPTCCLRGGCLTGPNHSGVELHGFLSYLIKCNLEGREYKVYGYKGKQVRDNIHSHDVAHFMLEFWKAPRVAEVYNLGGGKKNSCSILEAFQIAERKTGRSMKWQHVEENRIGDHICYYSDLRKMKSHYSAWDITKTSDDIFDEIASSWMARLSATS